MGNRIKSQRAGRGSPRFKANSHKFKAKSSYISYDETQKTGVKKGRVMDLIADPARTAVIARELFEDGSENYAIAAEGIAIGQEVQYGTKADLTVGNVMPLENILEGTPVFNIEKTAGDGGTIVRGSGLYALIVTKSAGKAFLKLPSGKIKELSGKNRATIGCASCGGREEKPLVKAGKAVKKYKTKGTPYPSVRGVAMNAVSHPFGGQSHKAGKSKSTSRNAPPGRKVGHIASSRTGRRKK